MYQSQYVQPANVMQFEHAQPTYVIQSAPQLEANVSTYTPENNPCCGCANKACFAFGYPFVDWSV